MTYRRTSIFALALFLAGFVHGAANGQPLSFTSAVNYGGAGNDQGSRVAVDAAGNVYVTGVCSGAVDFDPGPGVANVGVPGPFNAFVAKYAPSGVLIWARNQPAGIAQSFTMAVDGAGNVFTAGTFIGTCDFDPGPGISNITSVGGVNGFISKLDSNGNLVWAKGLLGGLAWPKSMAIDAAGNVYTSGYFFGGTIDFDPGAGVFNLTTTGTELFISKLDSGGNFSWALQFVGTNALNGDGLALDAAGNVYATASLTGTADLDPGPGVANFTAGGLFDPFVVKLTPAGTYVWAKQFVGGIGGGFGADIALDAAGNIYSTGYFVGTMDFDPGVGTANLTAPGGGYNIYVSKLDSNGKYVWARGMGGSTGAWDFGYAIAVDGGGNVYTTGVLASATADFDPGPGVFTLTNHGMNDIFVSMLDSSGNFVNAVAIGAANNDQGNHIAVGATGVVYVTGFFELTADFDPGPGTNNLTSNGSQDIFLIGLRAGAGAPPPPGSGGGGGTNGGEGSFGGSSGPGGSEGGFGLGRLTASGPQPQRPVADPPAAPREPILQGPFLDAPGGANMSVRNVSQGQTPPPDQQAADWQLLIQAFLAAAAIALVVVLVRASGFGA